MPDCINPALTVSATICPVGLVSVAITHFFEFISTEKFFENFKISRNIRSFPKTPLIPDTDIFNASNLDTLFIKL
jgi:hypothetical protein